MKTEINRGKNKRKIEFNNRTECDLCGKAKLCTETIDGTFICEKCMKDTDPTDKFLSDW